MKNLLYWVIGGAAIFYILKKSTLINRVEFYLNRVKVGGSLFRPTLDIEMLIQNPTNVSAELKSIVGEVYVNGSYVARFSKFGSQKIEPNSQAIFQIQAVPSLVGSFTAIKELLTQPKGSGVEVKTTGTANVDKIVIPFDQTISL
jgi:hypothetical protein